MTLQDLVLWAINYFFRKQKEGDEGAISVPDLEGNLSALLAKGKIPQQVPIKYAFNWYIDYLTL